MTPVLQLFFFSFHYQTVTAAGFLPTFSAMVERGCDASANPTQGFVCPSPTFSGTPGAVGSVSTTRYTCTVSRCNILDPDPDRIGSM